MRSLPGLAGTLRMACAVALLCTWPMAHAANITVNTAIDPPDEDTSRCNPGNNNTCSLRDAIQRSNFTLHEPVHIAFDPSITQINLARQIILNTRAGTVTEHVIDGAGRVVIDGGGITRLFAAQTNDGGTTGGGSYRLVGLTLRNGQANFGGMFYRPQPVAGGVLGTDNTITFARCRIEDNHATDDGGAIYAHGGYGVQLVDSVLVGNTAGGNGGALWTRGGSSIRSSTLADNTASTGGAVVHLAGTLRIVNSTISENTATIFNTGGGIFSRGGSLNLTNVTLAGNQGLSLYLDGNPTGTPLSTFRNTYVDWCRLTNHINVAGSHNITADTVCQAAAATVLAMGGFNSGALEDNGGPSPTHMPGYLSAAIDAGDDAACADAAGANGRDQRGALRPVGAHCDIGAVEAGAMFSLGFTVVGDGNVSGSDGNISGCNAGGGTCNATYPHTPGSVDLVASATPGSIFTGWSGDCSGTAGTITVTTNAMRACTASFAPLALTVNRSTQAQVPDPMRCLAGNANTCGLADAVAAASGGDTIGFAVASVHLSADVVFADTSGGVVTVDGGTGIDVAGNTNAMHRLFRTLPGSRTVFRGLRAMTGTGYQGAGAALYNEGEATLEQCRMSITRSLPAGADAKGGAIFNAATGTLCLDACEISGNRGSDGGGIHNLGTLRLVESTLSGNTTTGGGGGIDNHGELTVLRSTVSGNSAGVGGGILSADSMTLTASTVSGNTAAGDGGNLHVAGSATLVNSTVAEGSAAANGSGIANTGTLALTNVTLAGNGGASSSPGIHNDGDLTLANTIVQGCVLAGGTLTDDGGNLDAGTGCALDAPTSHSDAYLNLGALADNGGGTRTMLPGPGSAVFDAGIDSICGDPAGANGVDQRGEPRPLGAHCDAGAVESPQPQPVFLGGTATGQSGDVELQLTTTHPPGSQQATVTAQDTEFGFNVIPGSDWQIAITSWPLGQACSLVPDSGTALVADLDSLALTCTTNPPLEVSVISNDTTCADGGNGFATATVTGGTPPITYQWSPYGGTSALAWGLAAGEFSLTVTDALGAITVPVTIGSPPSIEFSGATLAPGTYSTPHAVTIDAEGGNGTISLALGSGTPPPGMDFIASPGTGQGTLTGTPTAAGSYTFNITAHDVMTCQRVQSFTLAIAPAPLDVTARDAARDFGLPNPAFDVDYSGFVNGDTEAALSPALTFATDALADSPPGGYAIVPSGSVGANYTPQFGNGMLTVTGRDGRASLAIVRAAVDGELITYEVAVTSHVDEAIDDVALRATAPRLVAPQWQCATDAGTCAPAGGDGAAHTGFTLGGGATALLELRGAPLPSAAFVDVTADLQLPPVAGVDGIDGRQRAVLVDPVGADALFADGLE